VTWCHLQEAVMVIFKYVPGFCTVYTFASSTHEVRSSGTKANHSSRHLTML